MTGAMTRASAMLLATLLRGATAGAQGEGEAGLSLAAEATTPTVTITQPPAGDRVSGMVQIRAEAFADPDPVERVDFWVINTYLSTPERLCTDSIPPYECSWDTRRADNGRAMVLAKAFVAGVDRAAAAIGVMVTNPAVGDLRLTIPNPMQSYERPRVWGPSLVYHDKFSSLEPYTGANKTLDLGTLIERDIGIGWIWPDAVFNNLVPFGVHAVYSEEYPPGPAKNLILYSSATQEESILVSGVQVQVGDLDFFGERVVWSDRGASAEVLDRRVHAIDVVTGEQSDLGYGLGPALWGNTAIWSSYEGSQKIIQSYDFSAGLLTSLAEVEGGDGVLGISGQWVVWTGRDPGQADGPDALHLLNTFTGARSIIATPNDQRSPAIWGGRIVWTETRGGNQDIYLYDLATQKETRVTDHPADQSSPDIFGDLVVWQDDRHGSASSDVRSVYAADLKNRLAQPRPLGYLEEVDEQGVARGWAVNPAAPDAIVRLAFYDGPRESGRYLGEALADQPRPEVNRMTGYPGDHGFEVALPVAGQKTRNHTLYVYILEDSPGIGDLSLLDGCPMVFRRVWS